MDIIKKSASKVRQNNYSNYLEMADASFAFTIMYNLFNLSLLGVLTTVGAAGVYKLIKNFIIKNEKYSVDYSNIRELYEECVNNIADLFKEVKIDSDPIKMNYLLGLIVNNGYLSKNYNFENDINNVYNFYDQGVMGAQVMTGQAYNYNISRLFRDVLNKLGIDSDIVVTTKFNQRHYCEAEITKDLTEKLGFKDEPIKLTDEVVDEIYNLLMPKMKIELSVPEAYFQKYGNNDLVGLYYNNEYILLDPSTSSCYYNYKSVEEAIVFKSSIDKIKGVFKKNEYHNDNLLLMDEYDNFAYILNIEKIDEDEFGVLDEKYTVVNEEFKNKINSISSFNKDNKIIKEKIYELFKEKTIVFQKFHLNNENLYKDIDLKMSKIKTLRR